MNSRRCVCNFLAAVFCALSVSPTTCAVSKEEMIKAAGARDMAFVKAVNEGNLYAMNACYATGPDVKAPRDGKLVYLVDHASMPMPPASDEVEDD